MRSRSLIRLFAAVGVLIVGSLSTAKAVTIPLASFSQLSSGKPFHYVNATAALDGASSVTPGTLVNFKYLSGFGGPAAGLTIPAFLTLSGVATDVVAGVGSLKQETNYVSIKFVASAGPFAAKTLLEVMAAPIVAGGIPIGPNLQGDDGAFTASIKGQNFGLVGANTTISYSADAIFLPGMFAPASDKSFSVSLDSLTAALHSTDTVDYDSFNATISGLFSTQQTVPEPGTMALLVGIGISGSLFGIRIRRTSR